MPAIFHHYHRVLDSEIDELDHANNAAYVNWMQAAAIAHSTAQGWPSERYWNASFAWVARSHRIDYLHPAFAGDELVVRTWVADMQRVSSLRRYEIVRESDHTVVARAETRWAFVDLKCRKPARIPPEVQADFVIVPDGDQRADSNSLRLRTSPLCDPLGHRAGEQGTDCIPCYWGFQIFNKSSDIW